MTPLYIVHYCHRHGHDVWPVFSDRPLSPETEASKLENFEPDRDEWVEVYGPFDPEQFGCRNG